MNSSQHAITRMQQRGISPNVVRNILAYGQSRRAPGGATARFISNKSMKKLRRQLPKEACVELERYRNVYVVMSDDSIITVGHRTRRFRNQ